MGAREESYKSGFTWRTLLALLYAIIVFQPVLIWMELSILGVTIGPYVLSLITFIMFRELCKLSGSPLTKQEAAIIMQSFGAVTMYIIGIGFLTGIYFVTSPIPRSFGITPRIPYWWAPPAPIAEKLWGLRTFFHPAEVPVFVTVSAFLVFSLCADISMGLIAREFFVKTEKLQFPLQQASANAIITLTEGKREEMRYLIGGANVGIAYSALLYGVSAYLMGRGATPLFPWLDFNLSIHKFFPGANLGIATSIMVFATGIIIPFNVVVSMLIGSIAIQFFGNWFLVKYGLTNFAREFVPGISIILGMQRSFLWAWMGPVIGMTLAAGIMPLLFRPRLIISTIKSLRGYGERGRFRLILTLWFASTLGSVIATYYLIPAYPLWIMLLFSFLWALIYSLSASRALGVTGITIPPTDVIWFIKYGYVALSNYQGLDIWYKDPVFATGAPGWCASFMVIDSCKATVKSLLKAYLMVLPIAIVMGIIYVHGFWQIAPIPSALYPAAEYSWSIWATQFSLWQTGKLFQTVNPLYIFTSFGIITVLEGACQFLRLPLSTIALAVSAFTPIPIAISTFFGAIVSKIIGRKMGDKWNQNKITIAAGIFIGEAIILAIFSAINLVSRSLWTLPY